MSDRVVGPGTFTKTIATSGTTKIRTPAWPPRSVVMDARFILNALKARHLPKAENSIFLEELRVGTGFGPEAEGRIDAWAMDLWPSAHFLKTAYEVKVSRGDFLAELRKPEKRRRALLFSNYFYFASPVGLVRREELPPEAGLIEVDEEGKCQVVVPAVHRDTLHPTWRFLASVARRIGDAR